MKRVAWVIGFAVLVGCGPKAPPEMVQHYETRTLYTCCNLFDTWDTITDANYRQGQIIPLGSPVKVKGVMPNAITFEVQGKEVTLEQVYGRQQEAAQIYFDKVFVPSNRSAQVQAFPGIIRKAIAEGRVEKGMTRGEVVLSIGFPPTDDNPVPTAPSWTFWNAKGQSYQVKFDANGYVTEIVGRPAPTSEKPVRVYASEVQ